VEKKICPRGGNIGEESKGYGNGSGPGGRGGGLVNLHGHLKICVSSEVYLIENCSANFLVIFWYFLAFIFISLFLCLLNGCFSTSANYTQDLAFLNPLKS